MRMARRRPTADTSAWAIQKIPSGGGLFTSVRPQVLEGRVQAVNGDEIRPRLCEQLTKATEQNEMR